MQSSLHPFLKHDGVLAFAHRGGDRAAPENTMAAFAHAVGLGYRYLETDVHASKDGVAFAFHDDDLKRMTGDDISISSLEAREVEAIELPGGHKIPKMTDLFEAFPDANFNIDAKAWPVVEPLAELIHKTATYDRVCIGAFSDSRVAKVVELTLGKVCYIAGPRQSAKFLAGALARLPLSFNAHCLQFPPTHETGLAMVTPAMVAYAHKRGLQVHVWTINDESKMHELLDMKVDGLMSDDCALLKSVLQSRNLW
ncbi:glycerophosphodiester phosphodiesterase family protein [Alphaproteobacteria bacterium]|nr:glycerophosphodiester phosphodiesterase family protein [Alphaproteobacteria bacterium]